MAGERVDRPPFSFWYHFGLQHMPGEAIAAAHLAFARRFEPDFLKVMNDYPFPAPDLLSIDRPTDWGNLSVLNGKEGGWGQQLHALETLVKALKRKTWIVETVYSPWSVLCRLGTRELVMQTAREHPGFLRHALETVAQSQANYVRHATAAGIQGIYFAVTDARHDRLSPAEYREWCTPYDKQVLEAAGDAPFNILHIHGSRIHFAELKDYPVTAVTWSHFHTGPGLARGLADWGKPVLGGLDETSLHRQTPGSLRHYFQQHAEELWLPRLILAPGCSLRPDISPAVLDAVRTGVLSLRGLRPKEGQSSLHAVLERPGMDHRPEEEADTRPRRAGERPGPVEGEMRHGVPPGYQPYEPRRREDGPPRERVPRPDRPYEPRRPRDERPRGDRPFDDRRPRPERPRADRPMEERPRRGPSEGPPRRPFREEAPRRPEAGPPGPPPRRLKITRAKPPEPPVEPAEPPTPDDEV